LAHADAFADPGAIRQALQPVPAPQPAVRRPIVQMAVLLDTSNSMDGLIAQAKSELWRIVNEVASYKQQGQDPEIQVALIEYGKQSLPANTGFIRVVLPFTTDLDRVSQELFALTANGGDEYCGQAVDVAVERLQWSQNPDDYKAIFIAGNEPFTQGRVDYRFAIGKARKAGLTVNTIHCGGIDEGIRGSWRDGADLGLGNFMAIQQNEQQVHIATPYDAEIAELGRKLNDTYIGYGARGEAAKMNQAVQDSNAASMGGSAAVERQMAKSKKAYKADDWDLVDAKKSGKKVKDLAPGALPKEMQSMSEQEREAFVDKKSAEREEIQKKITELEKKRQAHVATEMKKGATKEKDTFDAAMRKSLKSQLEAKKFAQ
jgi:hypothetical protein